MATTSTQERLSLLPQVAYEHVWRAGGGGDEGTGDIDFTIFGVAVTTLGLILCVELIRHRLDTSAIGRPFMRTVLESVYRELATLGIVEFFIFILHKYYRDLNVAQELVFADVHFTLFFTALFNAIQSCIMAFFISRHSHKLWVQTEYQDLHHYVEIREEFDRIEKKLLNFKCEDEDMVDNESMQLHGKARRDENGNRNSVTNRLWSSSDDLPLISILNLKRIWAFIVRSLKYPVLTRKHNVLLVQVRFHELKFHFLQANKLPITMHLSDYLKRCELHILQRLVHISTFAWLLLTGGINLLYFLMGVVVYTTDGNLTAVGKSLTGLYFFFILLFVLLSLVIWHRMDWIFNKIMRMRLISQTGSFVDLGRDADGSPERQFRSVGGEVDQKSLFWGGNPKYITLMIQFMQFGFALALSIQLVFWDDIDSETGINEGYFVLGTVLCYAAFVYVISHVVPRFTLCSSVGQMVDHRRLHETLARHRLQQARREREQALSETKIERSLLKELSNSTLKPVAKAIQAIQAIGIPGIPEKKAVQPARDPSSTVDQNKLFEWLVLTDTKELRNSLPLDQQEKLSEREERLRERKNRRKTLSDGVEAMRSMVAKVPEGTGPGDAAAARRAARRDYRRKSVSASASIQMMRAGIEPSASATTPREPEQLKAKDDDAIMADERAKRRANRKKTISASADIQMMRMATVRESGLLSNSNLKLPPALLRAQPPSIKSTEMPTGPTSFPMPSFPKRPKHISTLSRVESVSGYDGNDNNLDVDQGRTSVAKVEAPAEATAEPSDVRKLADSSEVKIDTGMDVKTEVASDDDDRSDTDDLPEVQACDRLQREADETPKPSFGDHWRSYFRGRVYVVVSAVFGTMICFFIIAQRLESVLLETGVLPDLENTWNFDSHITFWWEFAWFMSFVIGDLFILYLFRPGKLVDIRDRTVVAAAIIDLFLVTLCVGLLMGAEAQRCCNDPEKRWLAGDEDKYKEEIKIECCPLFGQRLYGGFGDMEMFTSLIALRLLRFWTGGLIVKSLDSKFSWSDHSRRSERHDSINIIRTIHPFDPLYDKTKRGRVTVTGQGTLEDETGTIVDLWKSALNLYPDIVEKYGEFSGELLQAMLGIAVAEEETSASENEIPKPNRGNEKEAGSVSSHDEALPSIEVTPDGDNAVSIEITNEKRNAAPQVAHRRGSSFSRMPFPDEGQGLQKGSSFRADPRYINLSADAQGIILAGKIGKAVKPKGESPTKFDASSSLGRIVEDSSRSFKPYSENQNDEMEFEVGTELGDDEFSDQFFAPNARLLRSMRRCDRKVIPLLDKWAPVDVVMTKYEIVYFDATDIDDIDIVSSPGSRTKRMQDIRQALRATKGGKGLRLRDVAYGRRVVGHQEIGTIETICVERILPHESDFNEESDPSPQCDEYWKEHVIHVLNEPERPPRVRRWKLTKEDRLKLKTSYDTLYLRFYSDLENSLARVESESELEGEIFKNNAFQWCQTFGRLVGSAKLKQELPHFGEDNSDELRDYLVVLDPESIDEKAISRFRRTVMMAHRRQRSEGIPAVSMFQKPSVFGHRRHQSQEVDTMAISGRSLGAGHRSESMEIGGIEEEAKMRPPAVRRTQSTGFDGVDQERSSSMNGNGNASGSELEISSPGTSTR